MKKILPILAIFIIITSCSQDTDYLIIRNDDSKTLHIHAVNGTKNAEIEQDINTGEQLSLRRSALLDNGRQPESLTVSIYIEMETRIIETGYIQDEVSLYLHIGPGRFYSLYRGDGSAISEKMAF